MAKLVETSVKALKKKHPSLTGFDLDVIRAVIFLQRVGRGSTIDVARATRRNVTAIEKTLARLREMGVLVTERTIILHGCERGPRIMRPPPPKPPTPSIPTFG